MPSEKPREPKWQKRGPSFRDMATHYRKIRVPRLAPSVQRQLKRALDRLETELPLRPTADDVARWAAGRSDRTARLLAAIGRSVIRAARERWPLTVCPDPFADVRWAGPPFVDVRWARPARRRIVMARGASADIDVVRLVICLEGAGRKVGLRTANKWTRRQRAAALRWAAHALAIRVAEAKSQPPKPPKFMRRLKCIEPEALPWPQAMRRSARRYLRCVAQRNGGVR